MSWSQDELCFLSATTLRGLYARGELSPVEVTDAVLARIERLNPALNAYVTLTPDLARLQAKEAEAAYRDRTAGLLAGIPISIKDLTATKGIRTTRGSKLYYGWTPDFDAPYVERVYAAGAVMLGKTNTPEFGWKGETTSLANGLTHNPWMHGRTPGGSSGGASAAIAAGLGPLAQGSDGAGSIRIPASFAGIFGLKPSFALIPQFPASVIPDLSHLGPMTRTVADAALLMNATAGADARDRISWTSGVDYLAALEGANVLGLRIAWSSDLGYAPVEPEVRAIAERAAHRFAELGATVEEAHPDLPDPWEIEDIIWSTGMAAALGERLDTMRGDIDPGLAAVAEQGRTISGETLTAAFMRRTDYYHAWRAFFDRYDLFLSPTLPCTAFPVGQADPGVIAGKPVSYLGWTAFTYPFNLTGNPAATVPCGFDAAGLPVGLQIVGGWRDDASVLRAAAAFEEASPWAGNRPPEPKH